MGYFYTNVARICEALLTAVGSHLTLSLGGIFFLGFPAVFWGGAYGYAIAAKFGLVFPLAVAAGIVLSVFLGFIFAFFYVRMSGDSFAVITLASVLAMDALLRSWDSVTGGVLGIAGVPRPQIFATLAQLTVLQGIVALAAFGVESILAKSSFGRSLRGLKENKIFLIALGTSVERVGQWAIMFASIFAGAAGVLTTMRIQFLDPSLGGFVLLLQALTIAIIANTPQTLRLLFVTAVIVLLPEILRFFALPTAILGYSRALLYSTILVFLVYYVAYHTSMKRNV